VIPQFLRRPALLAGLLGFALAAQGPQALAQQSEPEAPKQSTPSADAGPFDADETRAIGRIVREYLLEHPEVIMEAVEVLRQREQAAAERTRQEALATHRAALEDPGPLQVFGNPDGDVTVIEFFDYRCGYCRQVAGMLLDTVEDDGNVRLIMKEYPILGQNSVIAARAAIASAMQGKYRPYHTALMTELKEVDREGVLKLAEQMDLDTEQLQADMRSATVERELQRTFALAEALQIGGTPAFIVGDTLVPGALDRSRLERLIAQARGDGEEG
jgi:protein-disulfide isomerase